MPNAPRICFCLCLLVVACGRGSLPRGSGTGGVAIVGAGGAGGQGSVGAGGGGVIAAPCTGASDARLVVAEQRILRLTSNELLNTVRYLFGAREATSLLAAGLIAGDAIETNRLYPPLQAPTIIGSEYNVLDGVADHVAKYVLENFAAVTACSTPTDACATAYLDKLAARAYRRPLTPDEQLRFSTLYAKLRTTQTVNGYDVIFTVEEATSYAVHALLSSPQMLWRWEHGDPARASSSPAGIPLTDHELATHLAFFLTDQPPDDMLLAAAAAGTLRTNLPGHVERLLASPAAREWLRTIVETYFLINQLPSFPVDRAIFPIYTPALAADVRTETRMFFDNVLWNQSLTDILLSRTAFLNTSMARDIYGVPIPPGATDTSFVQTTLPADRRAGLLTNAAFLTSRGRSDGRALVVPRGRSVAAAILCMIPDPAPDSINQPGGAVDRARANFDQQTAQEQAAARAAEPLCSHCHSLIDPFGLALENYDTLGRYRTTDDRGQLPDARATLPAEVGGDMVDGAVELAQVLATKPQFTNCMARTVLQYAMVDFTGPVELPSPPKHAGCATLDLVERYQRGGGGTFSDLVRATAASPAFVLRKAAP
jgi:hypothetical protein